MVDVEWRWSALTRRLPTVAVGDVKYEQLFPVALFLLVYNATPNLAAYESYVYTAFSALPWQLSLITFTGQLGSLVGILLYWCLFVKVRYGIVECPTFLKQSCGASWF